MGTISLEAIDFFGDLIERHIKKFTTNELDLYDNMNFIIKFIIATPIDILIVSTTANFLNRDE